MTTINGSPSTSLPVTSSEGDPIRRYDYDRQAELFTLADAVDHLLMTEEINTNEPRAIERCVRAAKAALDNLPAYSPQGWRYYQGRSYLTVGAEVDVGEITVASGVVTATTAFARPDYMDYAVLVVSGRAYRVLGDTNPTFTVAGLPDGTYSSSSLQQKWVRLPSDFRRRGVITYNNNQYPVFNEMSQSIDSWQDTNSDGGTWNGSELFAAVTGDQRFHGELFLSMWPTIKTDESLYLTYDRYPRPLETHRVEVASASFSGTTATAGSAVFADKHTGAALVIGTASATTIEQSLSSTDLVDQKRVIAGITSDTVATIDRDPSVSGSRQCYISDIVDVLQGPMREAYLRLCEFELAKLMKSSRSMGIRESYFQKQLALAMADDSRYDNRADSIQDISGICWGTVDGTP